jgi:hypothetical protein
MDIHPPEHPIKSVRDFLLQIFTITCGIIIALSLDAFVTWRSDVGLARVARADFRAELQDNLNSLTAILPNDRAAGAWIGKEIVWGEAQLQHKILPAPPPPDPRSFASLSHAAWETALATQAIHRLRFDEARALSDAYSSQSTLNDFTNRAEEQWITMAGYAGDPATLGDRDARAAIAGLRVAGAYAQTLAVLQEKVIGQYRVALAALEKP